LRQRLRIRKMSDNLEVIKDKVRKLLALSKSDNENEATIALEKANELLSKYKLDEATLQFESSRVKSSKTYVPWRSLIGNAVAWLYACYHYRDPRHGLFVFTGEELNAFLASEMFEYLIKTIERSAKKNIRKNAKFKFRRSFKYGMADRIYDRIVELGLACSWSPRRDVSIEKAKKFVEKVVELEENNSKKNITLNRTALMRGVSSGNNVSLARQTVFTPVAQIGGANRAATQGELF